MTTDLSNTIIHGSCIMEAMPSGSVNFILTDRLISPATKSVTTAPFLTMTRRHGSPDHSRRCTGA
jgi:hypothetical protein